jgi:Y_Y_Y domain/Divergent InlB B-repeat domain/Glucodextranase, domain B
MRTHHAWLMLIFLIRCVAFSTLLAGVSSADNSSIFTNTNNIIAGDIPATFDLGLLGVTISPSMITAGDQLSSMDYLVQNYSTTSWSGTVNVKVYIFEQGKSVTSGTLIQNHSFAGNFTAKSSQRVTVQSPVIIPPNLPAGSYKIGVFLDILDSNTSNNANAFWGARPIWVDGETTLPTIQITTPTSNPIYPTNQTTIDIFGTASDNVGVTEVTWMNSSTRATGTASGTTSWAVNGISLENGSNVIWVTAKDAAGNKGTAKLTVTYTPVDVEPPDTFITAGPAGIITSNSATFTFTGSDNETQTSNLVYTTYLQGYDRGWSSFSSSTSITYNNLLDGPYTFQVQAKDQAGNIDSSPARQAFMVTQLGSEASCTYTLSAIVNPSGSGTVTKNPEKDAYCPGDQVTLNAKSNSGYPFSSWRGVDSSYGATAYVTMNGNRTSTAFFTTTEEIKLPMTWTDEGNRTPLNHLGHSSQFINNPLRIGDYYPISFLFENSGDVEIEVKGPSRMCIGLYSAANGRLLSYGNGLGEPKTMIKYPVSGSMAYHLVITPCISNIKGWTFSINGPSSSGDELPLNKDFRGRIQGTINSIYDRRFYLVTAPPNAGRRLIVTLLPEQNFNGLLRLFDDRGDTLVPSANNLNDGAIDVLTYGEVIPGQAYYICAEGYSANQRQGTGNYELRVEFIE